MTPETREPQALEQLAALEHEQWAHWTRYMLDKLTPEHVARWQRQIATPFEALSEAEKESDREWARKALEVLVGPPLQDTPQEEGHVGCCYLMCENAAVWEMYEESDPYSICYACSAHLAELMSDGWNSVRYVGPSPLPPAQGGAARESVGTAK